MTLTLAVIPAAGRGTRMRPATRVIPKAMLTVVDRPAIQHVVEEAAAGGATEIIIVVDPGIGSLVADHFDIEGPLPGLEHVTITPVVQEHPRGLGDAVLEAREVVDGRPFFCLLADNLAGPGNLPLDRLSSASDGGSVLSVRTISDAEVGSYGVVAAGPVTNGSCDVTHAVEKPSLAEAPSRLGIVGRYLFTSDVFGFLESAEPGWGGEIQLTDAINGIAEAGNCRAAVLDKALLDIGHPFGFAEACAILAAEHPDWGTLYRTDVLRELAE